MRERDESATGACPNVARDVGARDGYPTAVSKQDHEGERMSGLVDPDACVPAFVQGALQALGGPLLELDQLGRTLGMKARPGSPNPWALPVAANDASAGTSLRDAARFLPALLSRQLPGVEFRHIPFNTIPFQLYDDVFREALRANAIVGLGYDFELLFATGHAVQRRHLSRIVATAPGVRAHFALLDPGLPKGWPTEYRWDDAEAAVRSIDDGFWVIGSASAGPSVPGAD